MRSARSLRPTELLNNQRVLQHQATLPKTRGNRMVQSRNPVELFANQLNYPNDLIVLLFVVLKFKYELDPEFGSQTPPPIWSTVLFASF